MQDFSSSNDSGNVFSKTSKSIKQRYQTLLDLSTPYTFGRWSVAALLLIFFLARIYLLQGWYIICYALGIYDLNLFIAFLSPKADLWLDSHTDNDDDMQLPTRASEEFRPFIRRLPEFKFWYSVMKSTLFATFFTLFDCFNIPVFWPILVLYFITLFIITMKRQIKHMIKYRYVPFSWGKPKYASHEDTAGKVINAK
ncbi:protein RER1 isoform X5 [Diaphorina citri]|uniref:Protein RER1 n=1 Tax=Diaphorina citri TaxID=121845 RepID=A0A1S3DJQ7_DIACI|nr:protein RER1 isoform X6 [Diaphorina citri]XP_008482416.1 protein RER1 isoform X6 [Diaphorina citri]XP_017303559.1 protein RER1 isoform X5 [Diaphorina citri]XP_026686518.1 protein RER1 isoform X5 [Diaphorina citri]